VSMCVYVCMSTCVWLCVCEYVHVCAHDRLEKMNTLNRMRVIVSIGWDTKKVLFTILHFFKISVNDATLLSQGKNQLEMIFKLFLYMSILDSQKLWKLSLFTMFPGRLFFRSSVFFPVDFGHSLLKWPHCLSVSTLLSF
jgi:hypothetical protein